MDISRFWTPHLEVRPRQPCLLKLTLHPVSWDRLSQYLIPAIRGFWQLVSINSIRREIRLQTLLQLGIKDYVFEKTLPHHWHDCLWICARVKIHEDENGLSLNIIHFPCSTSEKGVFALWWIICGVNEYAGYFPRWK